MTIWQKKFLTKKPTFFKEKVWKNVSKSAEKAMIKLMNKLKSAQQIGIEYRGDISRYENRKKTGKKGLISTVAFVCTEIVLYLNILFAENCSLFCYLFIASVFVFIGISYRGERQTSILLAFAFTLASDSILIFSQSYQSRLTAMYLFSAAQMFHALSLERFAYARFSLRKIGALTDTVVRIALFGSLLICSFCIIGRQTFTSLVPISLFYYSLLLGNFLFSCIEVKSPFVPVGFFLFVLCDTIIGLRFLSETYGFVLDRVMDYPRLDWLFYAPSQALLAVGMLAAETEIAQRFSIP